MVKKYEFFPNVDFIAQIKLFGTLNAKQKASTMHDVVKRLKKILKKSERLDQMEQEMGGRNFNITSGAFKDTLMYTIHDNMLQYKRGPGLSCIIPQYNNPSTAQLPRHR